MCCLCEFFEIVVCYFWFEFDLMDVIFVVLIVEGVVKFFLCVFFFCIYSKFIFGIFEFYCNLVVDFLFFCFVFLLDFLDFL